MEQPVAIHLDLVLILLIIILILIHPIPLRDPIPLTDPIFLPVLEEALVVSAVLNSIAPSN
jgi:hypothetical protein